MVCCLVALTLVSGGGEVKEQAPLPWDVVQRRAVRRYNRFWNRTNGLFGVEGSAAPTLKGRPPKPHPAYTSVSPENGSRSVALNKRLIQALGGRVKSKKAWRRRQGARQTLLHEWAHVYQDPDILAGPDGPTTGGSYFSVDKERLAEQFARRASLRLSRGRPRARRYYRYLASPFIGPRGSRREVMREQFGDNWGKDPTTIGY